jgi:hypothetical protein
MKSTRSTDYIRIGLQYYVVGRFSTLCFYSPNSGNLFHHGLEMLFKGKLLDKYSPEYLQKEYSHNLPDLWTEFKNLTDYTESPKQNRLIDELHAWEEIRYPNYPNGKNIVLATMIGKRKPIDKDRSSKTKKYYFIFLDEIDELYKDVIVNWPLNPEFIKLILCNTLPEYDRGLRYYNEMNNYKLW